MEFTTKYGNYITSGNFTVQKLSFPPSTLACIFHKPWKRHYSVFAPHLSPTVLRAASQAALQRENLTSAWACEIFRPSPLSGLFFESLAEIIFELGSRPIAYARHSPII